MKDFRKILDSICDVFFVKKCVSCGQLLEYDTKEWLCEECKNEWLGAKQEKCDVCGKAQTKCRCGFYQLSHDSVRHLALYRAAETDSVINRIVYALKQSNNKDVFDFVAHEMVNDIVPKSIENTVCVSAPRSVGAIRKNGYDHSKKLARRVAELLDVEYVDALRHNGKKSEQKQLKLREERLANVGKYCCVNEKTIGKVKGKNVLLIDDIGTSGATTHICTSLLKSAGALQVCCILCARNESDR